jgi:hypothetical protein
MTGGFMAQTSQLVAFLAPDRITAERAARALETEGIPASLVPARAYHRLEPERVEVQVSAETAARARVIALAAVRE